MNKLYNFSETYSENPPVMVDKVTGEIVRHLGSSHRSAFWAGYDGLKGGIYPPVRNGSAVDTAYRAGVKYRQRVDSGKAESLPIK